MTIRILVLVLVLVRLSNGHGYDLNDFDSTNSGGAVYTPTKMKQSISDVPGSIYVVTREEMDVFGVRNVKEALLRISGMVLSDRGSDAVVSYHGLNTVLSRRVNVQINGVTIFDPAVATVPWNALPVSIDEIDRIEVNKSPSAATYGSNSFLAVINIITESPLTSSSKIVLHGDNDETGGAYYRLNHKGEKTSFNLSLSGDFNDGFDKSETFMNDYRGAYETNRINIHSFTDLGSGRTLEGTALLNRGERQPEINNLSPAGDVSDKDIETTEKNLNLKYSQNFNDHKISFSLNHYEGKTKQGFEYCTPLILASDEFGALFRLNRDYAEAVALGGMPSGGTLEDDIALGALLAQAGALGSLASSPICGLISNDLSESRDKFEIQDNYNFSKKLRMVASLAISKESAESKSYFSGVNPESETISSSVNFEYIPSSFMTVNFGGYIEDNDSIEDLLFAPRLGVNVHFKENHTIRVVGTRSYRSPDLFEQYANWKYVSPVTQPIPNALSLTELTVPVVATAPGTLTAEKIVSFEVGYNANLLNQRLNLDVKVFRDKLDDLISTYLKIYDFNAQNDGEAQLSGIEVDLKYRPSTNWLLTSGVGYLDNESLNPEELTTYKRVSGNVSLAKILDNWTISGSYRGASNSDNTESQNVYGLNVSNHSIKNVTAQVYIRYNPKPSTTFVSFPLFPNIGWRTGLQETLSDRNSSTLGLKIAYKW